MQILKEYFGGLVEDGSMKRIFYRWGERIGWPAPPATPRPRSASAWMEPLRAIRTAAATRRIRPHLRLRQTLSTARELAHAFNAIARDRRGTELTQWMTRALADGPKPIQSFAAFLQHDWDAVVNGLSLPWSSGVVEGQSHTPCCGPSSSHSHRDRPVAMRGDPVNSCSPTR
ncbi:transposase [Streptomyces sp. NPDC056390]|uniref:transposase n=1 Tax=Streptomyces sp. NPDC056390 TaxID=3345806 RepID=UPI0035DC8375